MWLAHCKALLYHALASGLERAGLSWLRSTRQFGMSNINQMLCPISDIYHRCFVRWISSEQATHVAGNSSRNQAGYFWFSNRGTNTILPSVLFPFTLASLKKFAKKFSECRNHQKFHRVLQLWKICERGRVAAVNVSNATWSDLIRCWLNCLWRQTSQNSMRPSPEQYCNLHFLLLAWHPLCEPSRVRTCPATSGEDELEWEGCSVRAGAGIHACQWRGTYVQYQRTVSRCDEAHQWSSRSYSFVADFIFGNIISTLGFTYRQLPCTFAIR